MGNNTVIKVENLSKQYRLGEVGTGTISHDLNRWWHRIRGKEDPYLRIGESNDRSKKGNSEYVWALQDINFEVQQGEVLGIIGKNGAGKSTLLKILSKVTAPTTGSIKAKGRIASLLEVGTGFHPELTGRENIYLNGTILGMTKREVSAKLDEIVDFAGVERYLDTPVKRYSSGMMVRLGFAVAAHLDPEILVVDEVLAVGDAEFQKKAVGKMQEVSREGGRTVIFVSHNLSSIVSLCPNSVLLDKGHLIEKGNTNDVIKTYTNSSVLKNTYYENNNAIDFQIKKVAIISKEENHHAYTFNDIIELMILLNCPRPLIGLHIGVAVKDRYEKKLFTTTHKVEFMENESLERLFKLEIPEKILLSGEYSIDVASYIPNSTSYSYLENVCKFEVEDYDSINSIYSGVDIGSVFIDCKWNQQL